MTEKEIINRLRCGAAVAHPEDVHLHVGPEVCKAAADLIEHLSRKSSAAWQPDQPGTASCPSDKQAARGKAVS